MMRIGKARGGLLLGALLVTGLGAGATRAGDDAPTTDLDKVMELPQAFLETQFAFEGRFHRLGNLYQPFFTMFDEYTHANFSAWSADRRLRDREDYLANVPFLYVDRKDEKLVKELFELAPYQRFEAIGVVRSIFGGKPFIEVLAIEARDRDFTPAMHRSAAVTGVATPAAKPVAQAETGDAAPTATEATEAATASSVEEMPAPEPAPAATATASAN